MITRSHQRSRAIAVWLVAAALAQSGCYRPQVVAGEQPPATLAAVTAENWPAVTGLILHVFNTGMNRVSPLLAGSPALWRPAPAFVIEHPSRGLIVFDCGLGPEIGEHGEDALHPLTRMLFKTRSRPGLDLPSQMRTAGLDPDAVGTVILSHFHFDHVGGADAFTAANFVATRGSRERSRSRMDGFEPHHTNWMRQDSWREIDFGSASSYATFDRSVDLFGDSSIILVGGGGHTIGGLGALIQLPGGPVFLAGDLVVHVDWLEHDDVQRIVADPERAADVRNRVRRLLQLVPQLVLIPGHDLQRVPYDRADVVVHSRELFSADAWPVD